MKIYVVMVYNGILKSTWVAGATKTKEEAEKIQKANEYQADKSSISEVELT